MASLPSSLALTSIADGSQIIAASHRNNYTAIQTAVNALIAITSNGNGTDGDAMVWDGVNAKWVPASTLASTRPRAPRVVTSAMSGGPPASPLDQDIWIATAVDANGTRWAFQYNAGSASASKWEFIGGAPLFFNVSNVVVLNTLTQVAATGFYYAASFSTVRAGDYTVGGMVELDPNGNANYCASAAFAGSAVSSVQVVNEFPVPTAGDQTTNTVPPTPLTGVAASTVIGIASNTGALGTNKHDRTAMAIMPVRIT